MSLKVGIVGLPNVGKSTLFNALLKRQQALAANYPFATVEPNVGIVAVPDKRLEELCGVVEKVEKVKPPIVPATVEVVDIAGIVKGAHEGEGLGNQFLANIREVDLIAHVVRDFANSDVVRTGSGVVEDVETIYSELIFRDLETIDNQMVKIKRQDENVKLKNVLVRLREQLDRGKLAREVIHEDEGELIRELFLLTMKPELLVVNIGEEELKDKTSKAVSIAEKLGVKAEDVVVVSAKIESEISLLSGEDLEMFMEEYGLEESGLERLAKRAYEKLELISFLTAGEKEVRAWTVKRGSLAPKAAGVIHSDFEKKFIKAEVVAVDDFVALGGWKGCREKGKVRLEGRDYVMADGDVVDYKVGS